MTNNPEFTYKDFYTERLIKPRKTERVERKHINELIDTLFEQHDYYSAEVIRQLALLFTTSTGDDSTYDILFTIEHLLRSSDRTRRHVRIFAQHASTPR